MALSLKREHLRRYRAIAALLVKYGRRDLVEQAGLDDGVDEAVGTTGGPPAKAEELAEDLEELGPTFVKLGQLLSTRPDVLPAPYVQALARLQDRARPFDFDEVEAIVERELGVRIAKGFAELDRTPMAAASLGQVHRAKLRDGRPVAVKVQRPGIRERITADLEALAEIADFVDRRTETGRRYRFSEMLAEFRRAMLAELDYRAEAHNLKVLAHNLAEYDRIVVPQPVDDYCTERVLTMELVGGRKVTSVGPLARLELDGTPLADELFRAYLQQVLCDGFFHADPHPGNVLLTDDGRLALLDVGMVARVSPELQDGLLKLLLAAGEGRGRQVAEAAIAMGERREHFDESAFIRRVSNLVAEHQGAPLQALAPGTVLAELCRTAGECGLWLPTELTMLGKALLNLDEVARTLDPSFDPNAAVNEHAATILRKRMVRTASPGNVLSGVLEAKEFAEKLPGRVNRVMDALAEGQVTLKVEGIDQRELLRGVHKLANRVTSGLVLAALIIGAAMLMRVDTASRLFGYPALAMVCFLLAAAGGVVLLVSIVAGDRR